ncbi:MAG: hemolysin family protein [Bellilinea sp.]
MDNPFLEIAVIFLLLLLNGVFAMSELAVISARKVRLQQKSEDGNKSAKAALALAESPNRFLSTVQIGITLVGIMAGALGGAALAGPLADLLARVPRLEPYAGGIAFAIVVLVTAYFTLVIGELIPKRLALNNPEKIAMKVARPMQFLSRITSPVVSLLSASTDLGLRLLGITPGNEPPVTEEEIRVLMEQGTLVGVFEAAEQDMIESVFRLSDRYIDAIMTPRTEIEWLDMEESHDKVLTDILNSNHSRFPAAAGSLDNVQGVLRAKDFFESLHLGKPFEIQDLLQPPLFVPDSMSALKVLEMIKEAGVHEALVLDEYGGLLGMVTLYDVLKAIVGEIPGPGDDMEPQAIKRDDGSWLLDGLLDIDDLKEILDTDDLPDEDRIGYQTLGGFVMSQLGSIPISGSSFEWNGMRYEILDMDGRRVDKVLVSKIPLEDESASI